MLLLLKLYLLVGYFSSIICILPELRKLKRANKIDFILDIIGLAAIAIAVCVAWPYFITEIRKRIHKIVN